MIFVTPSHFDFGPEELNVNRFFKNHVLGQIANTRQGMYNGKYNKTGMPIFKNFGFLVLNIKKTHNGKIILKSKHLGNRYII